MCLQSDSPYFSHTKSVPSSVFFCHVFTLLSNRSKILGNHICLLPLMHVKWLINPVDFIFFIYFNSVTVLASDLNQESLLPGLWKIPYTPEQLVGQISN